MPVFILDPNDLSWGYILYTLYRLEQQEESPIITQEWPWDAILGDKDSQGKDNK